ncbi:MAG: hypothetical protein U0872_09015 [Planctomycetaceae bacterium]
MSQTDIDALLNRIDAEFKAVDEKLKKFQSQQVQEYAGRKQRLGQLDQTFAQLGAIWQPRLQALADKFGDRVKVTPHVTPSARDATFKFQSNLARIVLRFSATTDEDVRQLILAYDLEILPILMKFDSHAELAVPLDQVDPQVIGDWVDDRIIAFVKTYLSLHENDLYLKDAMVEDPIAKVRFPKFASAARLERDGKTYYFIGDETRREFEGRLRNASS